MPIKGIGGEAYIYATKIKIQEWGMQGVKSINIPTSVSCIGNECFSNCTNLSEITIPSSVSSLGESCFNKCLNLSRITIPTSVSSIGKSCFNSCSNLSEITIPTSVSSLGNSCFASCSNLSGITIPSSVSYIGERDLFWCGCFYDCSKLKGHITIDPNNLTFRTDGTRIYRKDNGNEISVW